MSEQQVQAMAASTVVAAFQSALLVSAPIEQLCSSFSAVQPQRFQQRKCTVLCLHVLPQQVPAADE